MHGYQQWLFPAGKYKAVTLSYDDGTIHDRRLVSIFNQYGLRGSFHLNSGMFGIKERLKADEVRELYRGHEVAGHSVTHPTLTLVSRERIIREIVNDRQALEDLVEYPVRGFSYPNGAFDDHVVRLLAELGVAYARTTLLNDRFSLPEDALRWRPTCHHSHKLMDVVAKFKAVRGKIPSLLYVWGHSYEFDRLNNWSLMEEFGACIGRQPDIWYATNIEIVDYLDAVKRLASTVDGRRVYNSSAVSIWVLADGKPLEIRGGQIVTLPGS